MVPDRSGSDAQAGDVPPWLGRGGPASDLADATGAAATLEEFADLAALVHRRASERPGHAAALLGGDTLSYAELDHRMDRVAVALQRDGLVAGDLIAICAETSLDYLVVMFGGLRAGLAFAPLPALADPAALVAMAVDAGARLLFLDHAQNRRLPPTLAARRIIIGGSSSTNSLDAWLGAPDLHPEAALVSATSCFAILYSSGTTGRPKGIVQSHGMRWAGLRGASALGFGPETVSLVSTPLYSNTTLVGLLPAVAFGGTAVLMRKFEAREFLELSQRHRATHAMLVPVQYARIMSEPDFATFDLSSYRWKFCTSAPFPVALKADVAERWPGHLLEFYGMTEGGGTCALLVDAFPDKLDTVGRPLPGHDIRVIDEQERELGPVGTGEIVGHAPGMMDGYHAQPEQSATTYWHDARGRQFIRTGDIGHFDDDGFLVLTDRKKDLIISGGFNIFPSDLEQVLLRHGGIAEAAVVGLPSALWGETPGAFVVLKLGCMESEEALRTWANERLGKAQRISMLKIIDELPRNPIGKVQKRLLSEAYGSEPRN